MTITKDQWLQVQQALTHPYGYAKLTCDVYQLTIQVHLVGTLKYALGIYVDGFMKGTWIVNDCEERRRFLCPRKRSTWSPAQKATLTKGFTKREIAKFLPDLNKTYTSYGSHWSSFASLKRHLIANNKVITFLEAL